MQKDIHFKFIGFHGSDGRCHIRLTQASKDKPLVIVCSQYKNYYGTSVTNALELIAEKLFYEIANGRIEDVSFGFDLPIYEQWHSDANSFDKLLAKALPSKYHHRFKDRLLDILKIFNEIVWIEHYPKDVGLLQDTASASIVRLDENGSPHWQHRIHSSDYSDIGLEPNGLFVSGNEIDLEFVKNVSELKTFQPTDDPKDSTVSDDLESIEIDTLEFRQCRWINNLLDLLPAKIHTERAEIGDEQDASVEEKYVHRLISNILALKMPVSELFERDFPISRRLEIYKGGREKECDFVIYHPENKEPHSLIEVKRTSDSSTDLKYGVHQDLARLALCTKKFGCFSYILVSGDSQLIEKELMPTSGPSLSASSGIIKLNVSQLTLDSEYPSLLDDADLKSIFIKHQGSGGEGKSTVYIWEVSDDKDSLTSQRPYEFYIVGPKALTNQSTRTQ
ncbi:hypothetical protein F9L16_21155 [Agarivorans sp. B2Z047]|uniref:hypothetical protein n=1 Tax=Agarivorans sp. B2Z047 TaxID=2652721 RepID=UPI00128E7F25|nr:hypothetical protein [Agarivorans sp. B2Z047]MPW31486.1 hypothetical protein [Agarivorans sp. B2Z047]UQN42529.1 hypothetical protein LQZ07_22585 [Agarivorans sp. B2Z047]